MIEEDVLHNTLISILASNNIFSSLLTQSSVRKQEKRGEKKIDFMSLQFKSLSIAAIRQGEWNDRPAVERGRRSSTFKQNRPFLQVM